MIKSWFLLLLLRSRKYCYWCIHRMLLKFLSLLYIFYRKNNGGKSGCFIIRFIHIYRVSNAFFITIIAELENENVPLFLAGYRIIIFGKCTDDNIVIISERGMCSFCSTSKTTLSLFSHKLKFKCRSPVASPIPSSTNTKYDLST